jgi:hypothetical protein
MPNNSSARRDKEKKKNKRGEPTPLEKQVPAESVESFLSRSSADSGFQGDDDELTWESVAGEAALDSSLSSFSRLSSSAEPKRTRQEERARKRREDLAKELDNESDVTLSDESVDKENSGSRNLSLSPAETQFLASKAKGPLNRSSSKQHGTMESRSALATPVQVLEAKGKEASVDVPVEAVASVIVSGANSIQRGNQGRAQGSSSVSPPSPSFNLPPTERAQVLHSSLAAELIQAGSGTSPLIPPASHSQEPGTAISMSARIVDRRNNLNPSVQVPADHRTVDELRLRDELQRFGEACDATVRESREAAKAAQVETARLRQAAAYVVEWEQAASRLAMREGSSEARSQREASSSATLARTTAACTPVMDMLFCINNLDAIRSEAGDFSLKDFSDYWAPDNRKTAPNAPSTFVPSRLARGN